MPRGTAVAGVILADQVKSLDWRARRAKIVERVDADITATTLALVRTLL